MKHILLTFFLIVVLGVTCAQNPLENYDRLGLSVFFITYGNQYDKEIKEALKAVSFPEKFDNNMIKPYIIRIPASYKDDTIIGSDLFSKSDQKYIDRRKKAIESFFRENNIGRKIVA